MIGEIEGVLVNWKISRNYTECSPKRMKGRMENGKDVEKQTIEDKRMRRSNVLSYLELQEETIGRDIIQGGNHR